MKRRATTKDFVLSTKIFVVCENILDRGDSDPNPALAVANIVAAPFSTPLVLTSTDIANALGFWNDYKSKKPRARQKPSYKKDLLNDLRGDKGYAAAYLSAALADSMEAFLIALRDVAEAQKGWGELLRSLASTRKSLPHAFAEGKPQTRFAFAGIEGSRFFRLS